MKCGVFYRVQIDLKNILWMVESPWDLHNKWISFFLDTVIDGSVFIEAQRFGIQNSYNIARFSL